MSRQEEFRVDMHVKVVDEGVVRRAKDRGLDALVYAPHFTRWPQIRRRAATFTDDDLLVVPGREVFAGSWRTRTHVLALDLEAPVPDFITLEAAMAELDRQDAVVLVPHPEFLTFSMDADDVAEYADLVDAVESYNLKLPRRANRRAETITRGAGKPPFGSSYAHLRGTVGRAWTAFDGEFADEAALLAALRSGAARRVAHDAGTGHRLRRAAELGHVGWENTWKKLDRVFLSGTEPTHPDHIAYDGRFDEAAVY